MTVHNLPKPQPYISTLRAFCEAIAILAGATLIVWIAAMVMP